MKTAFTLLTGLALAASAFAGDDSGATDGTPSRKNRSAGPAGAYYRSNFAHNEVVVTNDSSDYMTFFVYNGDQRGSLDVHRLVRLGAPVYSVVVAPHKKSFVDQRSRYYWVTAKTGWCGIDAQKNRITGQ